MSCVRNNEAGSCDQVTAELESWLACLGSKGVPEGVWLALRAKSKLLLVVSTDGDEVFVAASVAASVAARHPVHEFMYLSKKTISGVAAASGVPG